CDRRLLRVLLDQTIPLGWQVRPWRTCKGVVANKVAEDHRLRQAVLSSLMGGPQAPFNAVNARAGIIYPRPLMSSPACKALFLLLATLLSLSAAASASSKSTNGLALEKNWKIQSSCVLTEKSGDVISSRKFETKDWIPASVPTTVLAAQL